MNIYSYMDVKMSVKKYKVLGLILNKMSNFCLGIAEISTGLSAD